MRVPLSVLALALVTAACRGEERNGAAGVFPFETHRVRLDNGLTAYLIRAGSPGIVAYVSVVRSGSRDEVEPGRTGYAHFFEHMMFRGTPRFPNYDQITSGMGAARNAFTSNDMTVYYLVAASEYLEAIMDLEADRFQNLNYTEQAFRTEAGAILGEYQQSALNPQSFLDKHMRLAAYQRHTYRHQTIGFEEDVRNMPEGYEYSLSFFRRFYRPENVILVIAGDFDVKAAARWVEQYYGGWATGYTPPQVEPEPEPGGPREIEVRYPGRTLPILAIGYLGPAWSATDRLAVAAEVLGAVAFGPNSELYKKLVIQEGRVQYLVSDFSLARDPSLLLIQTMVNDPADVAKVRQEILEVVEKFRTEPVPSGLLEDTKKHLRYSFLMGLETAQDVAFSLIPFLVNAGQLEAVEQYYATLASITAEEVQEAARQFLQQDRRVVALMTQEGN